jgi:hypothetical protein
MINKLESLNLLTINKEMIAYINAVFPEQGRNIERWDYVRFHKGHPYFYSKEYIEAHTLDDLHIAFSKLVNHD